MCRYFIETALDISLQFQVQDLSDSITRHRSTELM